MRTNAVIPRQCESCFNQFRSYNHSSQFCSCVCRGLAQARETHPNLKEDYFVHLDDKRVCYWLGFCCADASVGMYNGGHRFNFGLAIKDEHVIDQFIQDIGANPAKKKYARRETTTSATLQIGNRVFVDNLIAAGCVVKKTSLLRLPSLPTHKGYLAFLLGYFDGNGSLSKYSATITSGSLLFLDDIKRHFNIPGPIWVGPTMKYGRITLGVLLHKAMLDNFSGSLARKRPA